MLQCSQYYKEFILEVFSSYCSIIKYCLTLCDPMEYVIPGFPVLHYLPEFAQTHDHGVDDAA